MKKTNLKDKTLAKLGTALIKKIGRTSDADMYKHLNRIANALKIFKQNDLAFYVDDAAKVYTMGPKYTTAVKEMLTKADDEEYVDLVYGAINWAEKYKAKPDFYKPLKKPAETINLALAVENSFYFYSYFKCLENLKKFNLNIKVFLSSDDLKEKVLEQKLSNKFVSTKEKFLNNKDIDFIIVIGGVNFNQKILNLALQKSKDVLVCGAIANNEVELKEIKNKIKSSYSQVYFYTPSQNFYPYLKAKKMIEENAIGTVSVIKIKTVVGKFDIKNYNQEIPQIMLNDLYDKISYVYSILGKPLQNYNYQNEINGSYSAYTLLTKYQNPRTYSVYEFVYSPEIKDNKNKILFLEKIEFSGTLGYIWVNWQKTKFINDPIITMYRGDKEYKMGAIEEDFASGLTRAIIGFKNNYSEKKNKKNLQMFKEILKGKN